LFGLDNINPLFKKEPWLLSVPKDIRQQAVFELATNWKTTKGEGLRFKDKIAQGGEWVLNMEKEHIKVLHNTKIRLYSGDMKLVVRTVGKLPLWLIPLPAEEYVTPPCNVKLQKQGKNYYMLFSYSVITEPKPQTYQGHMIGLDPGMRKFQTFFGTDGRVGYFGSKNPVKKFARIEWFKDLLRQKLHSPKSSVIRATGKERKTMKKKFRKMQESLDNIRKDFHHKVSNWITNNYDCVVIGKLPKGIISKDRSLPKSVKRAYNSLGHYKFRCCLKDKCVAKGKIYQEINESYTSKTCTMCGKLNNVGSSETYKCTCQEVSWDRDLNGARNILLKALSGSYSRIVLKKDKTLTLEWPVWTQHPAGYSLCLNLLQP
jgi:IS605 OrfB family transposase